MKGLAIVALVCALGAAGAAGYGFVETKPNFDATEEEIAKPTAGKAPRLVEAEQADWKSLQKAMGREVVGAFGLGFLALVLGGIAVKKGTKGLGIAAIVIGLGAAGAAASITPQPLVF